MIAAICIVSYLLIAVITYLGVAYWVDRPDDMLHSMSSVFWPLLPIVLAMVYLFIGIGKLGGVLSNKGIEKRRKKQRDTEAKERLARIREQEDLLAYEKGVETQADLDYRNMHCQSCGKAVAETLSE